MSLVNGSRRAVRKAKNGIAWPNWSDAPAASEKPLPCCQLDGLVQQQGFAYARLPLHQHHTPKSSLSTPQQVTDYLLLRLASAHNLLAERSHWRPVLPTCSR